MSVEKHAPEAVHAVAVKLSPFSAQEPVSWFHRAEIQFRLRKITDPRTKADYVLESIPDGIFVQISHWLDDNCGEINYDVLKKYLLGEFTLTATERAQRLLRFPQKPLGDRTARAVWNEMQSLARLPEVDPATGEHKHVDLMRELWLQTLPSAVRAALHDSDSLSVTALIRKADNLLIAGRASEHISTVAAVHHGTAIATSDRSANGQRQTHTFPNGNQRRPVPRAQILPNGVCTYHDRFGDSARSCLTGCRWSKNA